MKKFLTWIAAALSLTLFTLCFTGCFSTPEGRQAREGKALMEAYLKTRDVRKYSVDSAATDRYRPAADRIEMTEFVSGKYRIDGQEHGYSINVKTGEIFTDERVAEFNAICCALMMEELGVDPARGVGLCTAEFTSAPSSRVIPAEIDDPVSYARSRLHSDELILFMWLVCSASEVPPGGWTTEDTADWNQDDVRVCVMPAGEALPEFGNGVSLNFDYFRSFTGDKYQMTSNAVEFTPRSAR